MSLATGGDGGGSIRIPAGYTGLLGMKGTFGRIPRSPHAFMRPNTVVLGNLARSVRDAARYYDVCAGYDPADPTSLPSHRRLGGRARHATTWPGSRVAIVPALGGVHPRARRRGAHPGRGRGAHRRRRAWSQVDLRVEPPNLAAQWMMGNLATLLADLGRPAGPRARRTCTDEVAVGLRLSQSLYNLHTAAVAEELRIAGQRGDGRRVRAGRLHHRRHQPRARRSPPTPTTSSDEDELRRLGQVEHGRRLRPAGRPVRACGRRASSSRSCRSRCSTRRPGAFPDLVNMGALTIISNIYGNPAVSIPAGTVDGLPVGMQVLARHHADALLFDVALAVERRSPWPLVAPPAPPVSASMTAAERG